MRRACRLAARASDLERPSARGCDRATRERGFDLAAEQR